MNLKKLLPLCLVTIFALNACEKGGVAPVASGSADIYIVGYTTAANGNAVATYWKNGIAITLTDSTLYSTASAITYYGKDIYIAGTIDATNGFPIAVYWKNGVMTQLTNPTTEWGYADAIAVDGANVYVAGMTMPNTNSFSATYWKNGVQTSLTTGFFPASADGIAVNNNNVYLCGVNSYGGALYWKNETNMTLAGSQALAITLNGNDVYVSGISGISTSKSCPTYWKNGLATVLDTTGDGEARAIRISGNDVYIAGHISDGNNDYGINNNVIYETGYWKNNIFTVLPGPGGSDANAIAVNGSDVYVAGYDAGSNSGYTTYTQAVYWKNSTLITLNQGNSSANGIAIVPE